MKQMKLCFQMTEHLEYLQWKRHKYWGEGLEYIELVDEKNFQIVVNFMWHKNDNKN